MTTPGGSGALVRRPDQMPGRPGPTGAAPGSSPGVIIARIVIIIGNPDGVFVYNGQPGLGNLIASLAGQAGTDKYGNTYPAGLFATQGTVNGVTINTSALLNCTSVNESLTAPFLSNPTLSGGITTQTVVTFNSAGGQLLAYTTTTTTVTQTAGGTYSFTVPANVTSLNVQCWGAGGGGGGGTSSNGGVGGGGGEFAQETGYSVTPGAVLAYIVGSGGNGSITGQGGGQDGGNTIFDIANSGVVANGGEGHGQGGTGSMNSVHHDGGTAGGSGVGLTFTGGSGGGGSAGATGGGGNSAASSSSSGTAGGAAGTGGGAAGGSGGNNASNGSNGNAPGAGGGGAGAGSATNTFNKTYNCTATHSYQGSDGTNPNQLINNNSSSYQGGNVANTFNGKAKTWIVFPASTMQSDLASVTVTSCNLTLNNNHSWYNSGMTVAVGWDTQTSFGSTKADPTGGSIDSQEYHVNEGATITKNITGLGTAFKNGTAFNVVLFKNSNNLTYYGYFAGKSQSGPPTVQIVGTTGGGSTSAGNGADGKTTITYVTASTLAISISPVAGTDVLGNSFPAGISTALPLYLVNQSAPSAASGTAALYGLNGQPTYVNPAGLSPTSLQAGTADGSTHTVSAATTQNLSTQYTIPANDMIAGACYELVCSGGGTWASSGPQQANFRIMVGGSQFGNAAGVGSASFPTSTAFNFRATIELVGVTTGVGGTVTPTITVEISTNAVVANTQTTYVVIRNAVAQTYDTTSAQTFVLGFDWASTTGTPSISGRQTRFARVA